MADFIAGVTKKRKVDVSEIHRSYIISELSKAASEQIRRTSFLKKLVGFLDRLSTDEISDLAKLLSNDYRKNAVYSYTTKTDFEWYEVEAPISEIYLTQTNGKENAILESLSPPWNLKSLIEKIQKGETEGLKDFLDKGIEITEIPIGVYEKINEKEEPKIKLIDGIHHTPPALAKSKSETLKLYLGIKLSDPTSEVITAVEGNVN